MEKKSVKNIVKPQEKKTAIANLELIIWLIGPILFLCLELIPLILSGYIYHVFFFDLMSKYLRSIVLYICLAIFPFIFKSIFKYYPLNFLNVIFHNYSSSNSSKQNPQSIPIKEPVTYFDSLVNINIEHLNGYYRMVKEHTNKSFILSLMLSLSGFILLTVGSIMLFADNNESNIKVIMTVSGILIEFISGCAFYLYNKTVRQLKSYFDSLVHVQKILLSFKVVDDTKDDLSDTKNIMMHKALEFIWKEQSTTNEKLQ